MYEDKKAYVRRRKGTATGGHHCHWPGCEKKVPPAMWGCYPHWMKLPKVLRDKVFAAYRPGQEEDKAPSQSYLSAALEVRRWIKANYPDAQ